MVHFDAFCMWKMMITENHRIPYKGLPPFETNSTSWLDAKTPSLKQFENLKEMGDGCGPNMREHDIS
jgi:hypothetical protein